MQCGVETMNDCERSPGRTGLRVNFTEKGEVKERREKFLTAKYGSHQMSLIRKRLAVEMWLYDELQKLFDPPVSLLRKFNMPTIIELLVSQHMSCETLIRFIS
jgi:protein phosphatase 1 regulatory subunit 14B